MQNKNENLLAVVGPTASGKSALAVGLAERMNGEVVSCDSMQIYKGFSIATAVPTAEEMKGIPHHLLSFADTSEKFSVVEYCRLAKECIAEISAKDCLPILCGGTGLYFNSLVDGIEFADIENDEAVRNELTERAVREGGEKLLAELAAVDPETAARLAPADHKRIIRAIEVYMLSGVTMSEYIRRSKEKPAEYNLCVIGLGFNDRQRLYDRVDRRVDIMLELGLVDETKRFYEQERGATAVQAIGYKEIKPYLDGECSLDEAADNLKRATRRYAKRQLSWFRRDGRINWMNVDEYGSFDELLNDAEKIARKELYGREE